jgi:hypothetical protein
MQMGLHVRCLCWATSTRVPVRSSCAVLPEKLLRTPAAVAVARAGARRRVSILPKLHVTGAPPSKNGIQLKHNVLCHCLSIASRRKNESRHGGRHLERVFGSKQPSFPHC